MKNPVCEYFAAKTWRLTGGAFGFTHDFFFGAGGVDTLLCYIWLIVFFFLSWLHSYFQMSLRNVVWI